MRCVLAMLLLGGAAIALAGCGGDEDKPGLDINGCKIQPNTVCQKADLTGADLSGSDLTGADLTGANLTESNLTDVNLTGANLSRARIVDASLEDANLTRADLTNATIERTDLGAATLCDTIRPDGTTDDSDCSASGGSGTMG